MSAKAAGAALRGSRLFSQEIQSEQDSSSPFRTIGLQCASIAGVCVLTVSRRYKEKGEASVFGPSLLVVLDGIVATMQRIGCRLWRQPTSR
jgi:hypothetical protein